MAEQVIFRATTLGEAAHAAQMAREARTCPLTGPEVRDRITLLLRVIAWAMGPLAQIILTDDWFGVLPRVVAGRRRILANVECVAVLFIAKTTSASLLILAVTLLSWPFPWMPRDVTLIGAFTIGIPACCSRWGRPPSCSAPGWCTASCARLCPQARS